MAKRSRIRRKIKRRAPAVRNPASAGAQLQSKDQVGGLMIGGAHDPAEKAADAMAARALGKNSSRGADPAPSNTVQRKANAPSVAPGATSQVASKTATQAITSMGAGRGLSKTERGFFEPRLGQDLSSVRVHDGPAGHKAAESIDADAFAHGTDIAFANGRNTTETMAHELAHVVQDQGPIHRKIKTNLNSSPDDLTPELTSTYGVANVDRKDSVYSNSAPTSTSALSTEIVQDMLLSTRTFSLKGGALADAEASLANHVAARKEIVSLADKIRIRFSLGLANDTVRQGPLDFIHNEAEKRAADDAKAIPGFNALTPQRQAALKWRTYKKHYFALLKEKQGGKEFEAAKKKILKLSEDFDKDPDPAKLPALSSACLVATQAVMYSAGGALQESNVEMPNIGGVVDKSPLDWDWVPGDWGYVLNHSRTPASGLEGENIIYRGQQLFWGHFDQTTKKIALDDMKKKVAAWNGNAGATVLPQRTYPSSGLT